MRRGGLLEGSLSLVTSAFRAACAEEVKAAEDGERCMRSATFAA